MQYLKQQWWAIGIGLLAGIFSGLLGVGGGVFLVPAMVYLMEFTQHEAHGTSLLVILFIAMSSAISYTLTGTMNWWIVLGLSAGSIAGATVGARFAQRVSAQRLRQFFGGFLILVAVQMVYNAFHHANTTDTNAAILHLSGSWQYAPAPVIGICAGLLSGLLGVGGGVIMVPAMVLLMGLGQKLAQGISLAVIVPTAVSGVLVHHRQGNIRPYGAILLILGGIPGGLLGTWLAHQLKPQALQVLFGIVMVIFGSLMLRPKK